MIERSYHECGSVSAITPSFKTILT